LPTQQKVLREATLTILERSKSLFSVAEHLIREMPIMKALLLVKIVMSLAIGQLAKSKRRTRW